MWVRLSGVCDGSIPMFRISVMVTYLGAGNDVSTRVLDTLLSIYEKLHNNLGGSVHPIRRIRSMQIILPPSSATNRIT